MPITAALPHDLWFARQAMLVSHKYLIDVARLALPQRLLILPDGSMHDIPHTTPAIDAHTRIVQTYLMGIAQLASTEPGAEELAGRYFREVADIVAALEGAP